MKNIWWISGLLAVVVFVLVLFGMHFYKEQANRYSRVGEWTIIKNTEQSYCVASINYSGDGNKMLIDLSTTPENRAQSMNFLVFGLDYPEYTRAQTLIVLTDKSQIQGNAVTDFHSAGQGLAVFKDGILGVTVPINSPADAKLFWQALKKTDTMVVTNSYGSLTLDVKDIRKALVETLECKALEFDSNVAAS